MAVGTQVAGCMCHSDCLCGLAIVAVVILLLIAMGIVF